jgi:hypothetical protein
VGVQRKAAGDPESGGLEDAGRIGGCELCLGSDGVGQRWQLSGASGQGLLSLIVW